jgi:hypothetical protein
MPVEPAYPITMLPKNIAQFDEVLARFAVETHDLSEYDEPTANGLTQRRTDSPNTEA